MFALTDAQRDELQARSRYGRGSAAMAKRARVILLLAAGRSYAQIQETTGVTRRTIATWKKRFEEDGTEGLFDRRSRRA